MFEENPFDHIYEDVHQYSLRYKKNEQLHSLNLLYVRLIIISNYLVNDNHRVVIFTDFHFTTVQS